jgi:Family of unknown function (DUF5694)
MKYSINWLLVTVVLMVLRGAAIAQESQPALKSPPIQVMVVGTFHMQIQRNSDVATIRPDDVTSKARQSEMAALVNSLATFKPTAVALEERAEDEKTLNSRLFAKYTAAQLSTERDERVQIGCRLASQLKLSRVYAIDYWNGGGIDGIQAWAKANQREAELSVEINELKLLATDIQESQKTQTVAELLKRLNTPPFPGNDLYYRSLKYGGGKEWPGAAMAVNYFERNAIIFARLLKVAKPGDRIVVIYGAGHHFLLKHFIENTPGFEYVSPLPFLK